MIYDVGDDRVQLENYLFEADGFGNIYVYKSSTMKFLDMIDVSSRYDLYSFLDNCREWIRKEDKEI